MSVPRVSIQVYKIERIVKMLDYKDLGFSSEDEMWEHIESEKNSEFAVWNSLQVWEVKE